MGAVNNPKVYFLLDEESEEICIVFNSADVTINSDKYQYVMKCLTTMPNNFSLLEYSKDFDNGAQKD